MIPGPYCICHVTFPHDSDGSFSRTLIYGFDTAKDAFKAIERVASDHGVPAEECAVIRVIEEEEADDFQH